MIVIGHRGAAGYRPEHTLAGYELAARMGADYIEPDLVSTSDGVLVARHENDITGDDRRRRRIPSSPTAGRPRRSTATSVTGWFTEDFTLAELKTLRAKERIPHIRQRNTIYDGRFEVPTFQEVIDLARAAVGASCGRPIGIYPETKHPTYFRSIGLPLEEPLVRALDDNELNERGAHVFVQSFEVANLQALDRELDVPLVQLLGAPAAPVRLHGRRRHPDVRRPRHAGGARGDRRYADAVGPSKDYIVPRDADGRSLPPTSFVDDAHDAGLAVHPYTFRNENRFLPLELRSSADPTAYGNALAEYEQFYALGVDGLFTDNSDTAVEARN